MVAIFEVKRTLRTSSLKIAKNQLEQIFKHVPLSKEQNDRYLPGGVRLGASMKGGKFSNPLIGIIGLLHEKINDWSQIPWFVDSVFSFQGILRAPKDTDSESLKPFLCRSSNDKICYREIIEDTNEQGQIKVLKGFVAYLLQYLNEVSGRTFDMNKYFS